MGLCFLALGLEHGFRTLVVHLWFVDLRKAIKSVTHILRCTLVSILPIFYLYLTNHILPFPLLGGAVSTHPRGLLRGVGPVRRPPVGGSDLLLGGCSVRGEE